MQINLLDDDGWLARKWPPERPGFRWRRKRIVGEHLGASLYELAPGETTFPYHYELGNDELLVVVAGRPTLRDPDGERELQPGDCVLFPVGRPALINSRTTRMSQRAFCWFRTLRFRDRQFRSIAES